MRILLALVLLTGACAKRTALPSPMFKVCEKHCASQGLEVEALLEAPGPRLVCGCQRGPT